MQISFQGQPIKSFGGWSADWLAERLQDVSVQRLEIAVAWVKRSGLSRVRDGLVAFRKRGGKTSAIVGIDEGGATVQGLELALQLIDDVRVYHVLGRRTFHPKVYFASGVSSAHLLVGSNNLTAGGLFLVKPSRQSWVGFLVALGVCLALVGIMVLLLS